MKLFRFIGKRGRTTIPLQMRVSHDIHDNDFVSFEDMEDGSIVIRQENICEHRCFSDPEDETTIYDILNCLTNKEKEQILIYLAKELDKIER